MCKYYFSSIFLHVALLLVVGIYVDFSPTSILLGDAQNKIVKSYLYKDNFSQFTDVHEEKLNSAQTKKTVDNSADKMKQAKQVKKPVEKMSQQASAKSSSRGQQTETLLALLHDAIQKQQHYPPSALEMERQGRATVKFMLSPSGSIQDLRIVKSSGTQSLDDAALAAVNRAAPFRVEEYLDAAREFSIDVVFELS